jgi:hypothetical protein
MCDPNCQFSLQPTGLISEAWKIDNVALASSASPTIISEHLRSLGPWMAKVQRGTSKQEVRPVFIR